MKYIKLNYKTIIDGMTIDEAFKDYFLYNFTFNNGACNITDPVYHNNNTTITNKDVHKA